MKFFATAAALASLVPGILSLTINTPSGVTSGEPVLISWTGGIPPYYLSIIPGGQIDAAPLEIFDIQMGNQFIGIVDIPGGTKIKFVVKDNTGARAYTDLIMVYPAAQGGPLK